MKAIPKSTAPILILLAGVFSVSLTTARGALYVYEFIDQPTVQNGASISGTIVVDSGATPFDDTNFTTIDLSNIVSADLTLNSPSPGDPYSIQFTKADLVVGPSDSFRATTTRFGVSGLFEFDNRDSSGAYPAGPFQGTVRWFNSTVGAAYLSQLRISAAVDTQRWGISESDMNFPYDDSPTGPTPGYWVIAHVPEPATATLIFSALTCALLRRGRVSTS